MCAEPAELPGRNSVPGPIHRTIVYRARSGGPRFAWPLACCPEQLHGFYPGPQAAPRPEPEQFVPIPRRSRQKKGPSSSPSPDTPNNSPIPSPRIPASPRKRSYMPDYGFIYYLLLSHPHHLMLALRFSFFALPYA